MYRNHTAIRVPFAPFQGFSIKCVDVVARQLRKGEGNA
jgi:hypothetical protein